MKALILVGGYGTRLRPLTLSVPKPLIQFCNRPIIEYQIQALVSVGVKHAVLAVAYQPETMLVALRDLEKKYAMRLDCSIESEPLLTAGPLKLAEKVLCQDSEGEIHPNLIFVFNSDIICDFPLADMLQKHLASGAEGTICVKAVDEPSKFGVVLVEKNTGKVTDFIEKPPTYVGNHINAGIYLLDRKVLSRIQLKPTSIEREVFPLMAKEGVLFAHALEGYWADIGRPADFLEGTRLFLKAMGDKGTLNLQARWEAASADNAKEEEIRIYGNVLIDESARIGRGCHIGPDVTIGKKCIIGEGCRIQNAALMERVSVGSYSWIDNAILGWSTSLGSWVRLEGLAVLGQSVIVRDECYVNGAFVLPHKILTESVRESGTIIM